MSTHLDLLRDEPAPVLRQVPPRDNEEAVGVTIIEPPRGWQLLNLRELWQFHELLFFLTWRDVKVRYKQTLLGATWAILQPAMMMVVFTIFFGRMAGVSSGDIPYPVFVYAGLLPWTFFATAINQAGNSVVGSERMITKIYFPRLTIPFASVGAALVDFAIAFGLLLVLMVYYGIQPGLSLLLVPLILGIIVLTALGIGAILAALNVKYRDFRYVIPFLIQIWLFATPSVYMETDAAKAAETRPAEAAPPLAERDENSAEVPHQDPSGAETSHDRGTLRSLMALNPMTGLIAAHRAVTLGGPIPWGPLGISSASSVLLFLVGCLYFRRAEDHFADVI